jgi:hypothetical protein
MRASPATTGTLGISILLRGLAMGGRRDLHSLLGCESSHRCSGHDVGMGVRVGEHSRIGR